MSSRPGNRRGAQAGDPVTPARPIPARDDGTTPAKAIDLDPSNDEDEQGNDDGETVAPGAPTEVTVAGGNAALKLGLLLCSQQAPGASAQRMDNLQHITSIPNDTSNINVPTAYGSNIASVHWLQADMGSWVQDEALATAVDTLAQRLLPPGLREMVHLTWDDATWFNGVANLEAATISLARPRTASDRQFRAKLGRAPDTSRNPSQRSPLHNLRQRPWWVMPVNINGNHWITVIVHLTDRPAQKNPHNYYNRVEGIWILNGLRARLWEHAVRVTYYRLEQVLRRAGLTFPRNVVPDDWRKRIWTPPQPDANSCGVRVYVNIKLFLQRLARAWALLEDRSRPPSPADDFELWTPLPGWFDPELERWEMIGSNAAAVVRACDYRARVAVEMVRRDRGGADAKAALGLPAAPPAYAPWDDEDAEFVRVEVAISPPDNNGNDDDDDDDDDGNPSVPDKGTGKGGKRDAGRKSPPPPPGRGKKRRASATAPDPDRFRRRMAAPRSFIVSGGEPPRKKRFNPYSTRPQLLGLDMNGDPAYCGRIKKEELIL